MADGLLCLQTMHQAQDHSEAQLLRPEAKRLDINGQELETHPNPGCSTSPPLSTLPSLTS